MTDRQKHACDNARAIGKFIFEQFHCSLRLFDTAPSSDLLIPLHLGTPGHRKSCNIMDPNQCKPQRRGRFKDRKPGLWNTGQPYCED